MNSIFYNRKAKILVDILLIAMLFISMGGSHEIICWNSFHCMTGTIWTLLMGIHLAQNWKLVKVLKRKKVFMKNKITAITTVSFILITISILFLAFDFRLPFLKFHNIIGHFFALMLVIHIVDKFKRLIYLFRKS